MSNKNKNRNNVSNNVKSATVATPAATPVATPAPVSTATTVAVVGAAPKDKLDILFVNVHVNDTDKVSSELAKTVAANKSFEVVNISIATLHTGNAAGQADAIKKIQHDFKDRLNDKAAIIFSGFPLLLPQLARPVMGEVEVGLAVFPKTGTPSVYQTGEILSSLQLGNRKWYARLVDFAAKKLTDNHAALFEVNGKDAKLIGHAVGTEFVLLTGKKITPEVSQTTGPDGIVRTTYNYDLPTNAQIWQLVGNNGTLTPVRSSLPEKQAREWNSQTMSIPLGYFHSMAYNVMVEQFKIVIPEGIVDHFRAKLRK